MKIPHAIKIRPFAFSCMLFLALLFAFFYMPPTVKYISLSVGILAEITLFIFKSKRRFLGIYVLPALIVSAAVSLLFFANYNNVKTYDGHECKVEFVITDVNSQSESYSSFAVKVISVNGEKADFYSNLTCNGFYDAELFSVHSANVFFEAYTRAEYDRASYLSFLSKDIYLSAYVTDAITDHNRTEKLFPDYYFSAVNRFCSDILTKHSGEEGSALSRALLLGNRDALNNKTVYHFRLLGLSHMLAVSGLHLAIIIGSLSKLLKKTGISAKKRCFLIISAIIFYAGITGFSSSVKRASIMLIIFYISTCILRRNDGITSLCFAISVICFFSPSALFDIGLWLSFLSTYGILLIASPLSEKLDKYAASLPLIRRPFVKLFSLLVFGCVPIMFSLPVIWLSFGELAVVSPLSNIVFTPLLLAVMYLCPLVIIFSLVPVLSSFLGEACAFFSNAMTSLAELLSEYAPVLPINFRFAGIIFFLLAITLLVISLSDTKKRSLYFIPFVSALVCFTVCFGVRTLITDEQQSMICKSTYTGDIVMAVSENKAIFCDVSGMSPTDSLTVKSLLYSKHITQLHSYVVTDYTKTKPQDVDSLLSYTKLNTMYVPTGKNEDDIISEKAFKDYARQNGIECISYDMESNCDIEFFGMILDIRKNVSYLGKNEATYSISFSGKQASAAYIGMADYTDVSNFSYLNKNLQKDISIIFGSCGREAKIYSASLSALPKAQLFFPSDTVYGLYKDAFVGNRNVNIFSKSHEVLLNQ